MPPTSPSSSPPSSDPDRAIRGGGTRQAGKQARCRISRWPLPRHASPPFPAFEFPRDKQTRDEERKRERQCTARLEPNCRVVTRRQGVYHVCNVSSPKLSNCVRRRVIHLTTSIACLPICLSEILISVRLMMMEMGTPVQRGTTARHTLTHT